MEVGVNYRHQVKPSLPTDKIHGIRYPSRAGATYPTSGKSVGKPTAYVVDYNFHEPVPRVSVERDWGCEWWYRYRQHVSSGRGYMSRNRSGHLHCVQVLLIKVSVSDMIP